MPWFLFCSFTLLCLGINIRLYADRSLCCCKCKCIPFHVALQGHGVHRKLDVCIQYVIPTVLDLISWIWRCLLYTQIGCHETFLPSVELLWGLTANLFRMVVMKAMCACNWKFLIGEADIIDELFSWGFFFQQLFKTAFCGIALHSWLGYWYDNTFNTDTKTCFFNALHLSFLILLN